ncbi:ABC transporter ATP-binding protein [Fusobacterium sp.]|uniref:ABC transporter ATP-binding protein n=1 Tax=Fusobacterium sp. TaxID=68766 RepID=UPI00396CB608
MKLINIHNLHFSYGHREILKGIDITFKDNQITGILGPNGCGKSTLLKNILGYLKNSSGEIKLGNKNLADISQKEKARIISFVPQKSQLISDMSVQDFVLLGRLPHLKNTWDGYTKHDNEIVRRYLKELELEKFLDRKATTLSGGEFQRVLLARALVQETDIILLDEPTSALDLNHALDLMTKLKRTMEKKDLTAIVVLHDLNLAAMFCDEIVMLKDGKVYCQGTPVETLTRENLKKIYNLNCDIFYTDENIPYVIPKLKGEK